MRTVAIFLRPNHPLDDDLEIAITRLRYAGILATEERLANKIPRCRVLCIPQGEDQDPAVKVLHAVGLLVLKA